MSGSQSPGEIKRREVELPKSHSWMDCLAVNRAQERSRAGTEMELNSHSWMVCLAADKAQERSRAGRWSWSLTAGWIVLLLTESMRDQEERGGAEVSQLDGLSCC